MTISEAIRNRIYELCDERQITVNKLSTISGVTQSTVSDIMSGVTASARMDTVKKLCDGLEISVRRFFDSPMFDDLEQELK